MARDHGRDAPRRGRYHGFVVTFAFVSSHYATRCSAFDVGAPPIVGRERGVGSPSSRSSSSRSSSSSSSEAEAEAPPAWAKCVNGVAPRTCALNEAVSRVAGVSLEAANDLVRVGAVWARFDEADDAERNLNEWGYRTDNVASYHDDYDDDENDDDDDGEEDLDAYVAKLEADGRYERVLEPRIVEAGTDLRVYPVPRRFPACHEMGEPGRLLYEDTTFLVVDKPPMLPTQPDASNYLECCPGCAHDLLGPFFDVDGAPVDRPLLCHRVDSPVGGCVVLSKDRNGQRVFAELQRQRKLKKLYLTLTRGPVPLGQHVHWLFAPTQTRGNVAGPSCQLLSHAAPANRKAAKAWTRCVLEVTRSERVPPPPDADDADDDERPYYQSTVRLVTGRKHQVRAQLASLGRPVVHDSLYEPIAGVTLDSLSGGDPDAEAALDAAVSKCRVPTRPIGLQAHAILFGGVRAKARAPWWATPPES